jgi:dipeptidyl aminopeptidase/acylaminoacyl peptidase
MPPWWESLREALYAEIGHPQKDREYLQSISPLFHAKSIVKPLMVLQGANDPRVGKSESEDIVAAARANGAPVEYLVFEDEGHSFRKKENRLAAYRSIVGFLDTYLKAARTTGAPHPRTVRQSAR